MVYDGAAEKDIRGIDVDKAVKGFGKLIFSFKSLVNNAKAKAREIRWYKKGLTLATAMNALDTLTTQGVTGSIMTNTAFKARPAVIEQKWERTSAYVKKYFVESPTISIEDIKDSDIDVLGGNLIELVKAVHAKVDRRIYDVLTEATVTSGVPNPSDVHTTAAVAGWATTGTCQPIRDILIGKRKIRSSGYDPTGCTILMNELEEQSLLDYLISVKGSSIPDFSSEKVKDGVVMGLLNCKVVVSTNATADWVIMFKKEAVTYKTFIPITSVVMVDPGIGKKIRVWEEGEAILEHPKSVHIISSAS